jgi:hypothetical protein
MALWSTYETRNENLNTVLYFLRDGLASAIADAALLASTACSLPRPHAGAGHNEISAQLGRLRQVYETLRHREALFVTKLLRAREWAVEARKLAPQIKAEADQFLEAVEHCEELSYEYTSDPQRIFHGGDMPSRLLSRRPEETRGHGYGGHGSGAGGDYYIAGKAGLLELRVACEVFLGQIQAEFFSGDASPTPQTGRETFLPYLDLDESDVLTDSSSSRSPPTVH